MKKLNQKAFAIVLMISLILTSFMGIATATEVYESVPSDKFFSVTDNFTREEYVNISAYPVGASTADSNISSSDELGLDKSIDGIWTSKKGYSYNDGSKEYAATMTGINTGTGKVTFGISETEGLFIDAPRNYDSGGTRILPKTLPTTPGINYNMSASDLTDNFVINLTTQVSNNVNMWGIKFMQHNNEKNYYLFYTGGTNTLNSGGKNVKWAIYKVRDGAIVGAKEFTNADTSLASVGIGANHRLTLSFIDGTISFKLGYGAGVDEYFSGSWTDTAPYTKANVVASAVDGKIAPVQLIAAQGGGTPNAVYRVKFRQFSIKDAVPYLVTGEPDTVMYADVSESVNEDVIDLGKAYTIRKIKNNGELTEGDILVSNDNVTYKKLTDISKFTDGEWLNNVTANKYRYVKSAAGVALEILAELNDITRTFESDMFKVYAKVGGEEAAVAGGNEKIAVVEDGLVKIAGIGKTTFTASNENGTVTGSVNITSGNNLYTSSELDVCENTENIVGSDIVVSGTFWRTKNAEEGYMGKDNNAPVKLTSNKLRIYGSSNSEGYTSALRYNQSSNNEYYPALVYEGINTGANQIIDITFKKSDAYSYPAIKILAHNNGDGYILAFSGNNDGDKIWYLYKELNGVVTLIANGEGISDVPAGTFPLKNGESKLRICYANGSIGFTLNYNNEYTLKGSYYDPSSFNLSGVTTDLWLMAGCKYGNITNDNLLRYIDFYDISINKFIDNGYEFESTLYDNKADGKAFVDEVLDLGVLNTIYYIKASNVSEATDVYASADGERYYYLTSFNTDGYYQNTTVDKAFRYIKIKGSADVKVFTKVNALSNVQDADITVTDNVNLTVTSENLAFTKGQKLIVATYDENEALASVKDYNISFDSEGIANVTVDDFSSAYKVKAFIWNSIKRITPVTNSVDLK